MKEDKPRNDANERKAFNKEMRDKMASEDSQLHALTDGEGKPHSWQNGWVDGEGKTHFYGPPGFHTDVGKEPGWVSTSHDAGHMRSSASGENLYAMEDRSQNRSEGARLEKKGVILEKQAVEIEPGKVMERRFAEKLEARGVLREGTVESAPEVKGWKKGEGVVRDGNRQATGAKEAQGQSAEDQPAAENWQHEQQVKARQDAAKREQAQDEYRRAREHQRNKVQEQAKQHQQEQVPQPQAGKKK